MLLGYARVSTTDQNTAVQVSALRRAGVDKVFEEQRSAVKARPVLDGVLASLSSRDTLVVYKLDRLARSMGDFVKIFDRLRHSGAGFRSLTEAVDTATVQGRMFLNLLGVFAEFERELIRERCLAGQVAARARGQQWGRLPVFSPAESLRLVEMWRGGWAEQRDLAAMFGVSVGCIRDAIHKAENRGRWATKK